MLENTTVITYHSPTHIRFYEHFRDNYNHNFKSHISYTMDWVKSQRFYKKNIDIFKYKKYFGYFLWKPYILLDAFRNAETENILYCDSNMKFKNIPAFNNRFEESISKDGIFLIKHKNFLNREWTKRDTFVYMDLDNDRYWNANQVWSVIMGFKRTSKNQLLLEEYMSFCVDENILTELPNTCGLDNLPGFREHRWEQSIMSLLVEKYKIPTDNWDTEFIHYIDKYYDNDLLKLKEEVNKNPLEKE